MRNPHFPVHSEVYFIPLTMSTLINALHTSILSEMVTSFRVVGLSTEGRYSYPKVGQLAYQVSENIVLKLLSNLVGWIWGSTIVEWRQVSNFISKYPRQWFLGFHSKVILLIYNSFNKHLLVWQSYTYVPGVVIHISECSFVLYVQVRCFFSSLS